MRNDSILNTGLTSASINKAKRAKESREARKRVKESKKSVLTPAAEVVNLELEAELKKTQLKLLAQIQPSTNKNERDNVIETLNLYTESMRNLKRRLSTIMRVKPTKGEDFDD